MNHWKGEVDFAHFRGDNLNNVMDATYNHTKLHNVIWTNELARRLQGTGMHVQTESILTVCCLSLENKRAI